MFGVTEKRLGYPEQEVVWEGVKFKPIIKYSEDSGGFPPYIQTANSDIGSNTIPLLSLNKKEQGNDNILSQFTPEQIKEAGVGSIEELRRILYD